MAHSKAHTHVSEPQMVAVPLEATQRPKIRVRTAAVDSPHHIHGDLGFVSKRSLSINIILRDQKSSIIIREPRLPRDRIMGSSHPVNTTTVAPLITIS